jgi:hypothetical protein
MTSSVKPPIDLSMLQGTWWDKDGSKFIIQNKELVDGPEDFITEYDDRFQCSVDCDTLILHKNSSTITWNFNGDSKDLSSWSRFPSHMQQVMFFQVFAAIIDSSKKP